MGYVRQLFAMCMDTGKKQVDRYDFYCYLLMFRSSIDRIEREGMRPLKDALERVFLRPSPPIPGPDPKFDLLWTTMEMQKTIGIEMFYSIGIRGKNPYGIIGEGCITILRPDFYNPPLPT